MAFDLVLTRKAEKGLNSLPHDYRAKAIEKLIDIQKNPFSGKALSGNRKGQYSARIWPYRIIYTIEKKELIIIVIDVDHRGEVYK